MPDFGDDGPRGLTDTPFVTLTEAVTWLALGDIGNRWAKFNGPSWQRIREEAGHFLVPSMRPVASTQPVLLRRQD